VLCDGFERYPGLWGTAAGGGGTESQDIDDPRCGDAAGRTDVVSGDTYAVLIAGVPMSVASFVDGRAAEPGFVRLLQLQLPSSTGQWYAWMVDVAGGQTRLVASNHASVVQTWAAGMPLPDGWAQLELAVDNSTQPPSASVFLDGALLVESDATAPTMLREAAAEMLDPILALGPYAYQDPFTGSCTARFDEVWVSTSTPPATMKMRVHE
jgi:hypothetical protein